MKAPILVFSVLFVCSCFDPVQLVSAKENVKNGNPHGSWKKKIALLPVGERVKLKTVHALAMRDRAVRVAEEKRKQADKEFHDILRATMLKIDPTVQPILDKMP
jgi:hypothetical protein